MTKNDGGKCQIEIKLRQLEQKLLNCNQSDLRDWFAGQQLIAYRAHPSSDDGEMLNYVAEYCYKMADAMIKAREE